MARTLFESAASQGKPQAVKNRDMLARRMQSAYGDEAKRLADARVDAHQPAKQ